MIEEQQAEYDEYVRRCGGVPISTVPPPNKATTNKANTTPATGEGMGEGAR